MRQSQDGGEISLVVCAETLCRRRLLCKHETETVTPVWGMLPRREPNRPESRKGKQRKQEISEICIFPSLSYRRLVADSGLATERKIKSREMYGSVFHAA
jgi:hypothetical protein